MNTVRWTLLFLTVFLLVICLSCASAPKKDIESQLISAFIVNCKTAEIKFHGDLDIYVISPTGKVSANGCPIAAIKGWREGKTIKEKEVEVCECGQK